MLSRYFSRLVILTSVATLAGVTYYFMDNYRALRERERTLGGLATLEKDDGPCAALSGTRRVPQEIRREIDAALKGLRHRLATEIVGGEDTRSAKALLAADNEGLVDSGLCEQIRLARSLGEEHPVLALLRYTRAGGSPCDEEPRLASVLDGLGSHRALMLHALMKDVEQLRCLSPALNEKIAAMLLETAFDSPQAFDDLDVLRISRFATETVPLIAAQFGCRSEARGDTSLLGSTLGCPPDAKRRVLVHYTTLLDAHDQVSDTQLAKGSEAILLRERGPDCEFIAAKGDPILYELPCESLRLSSDILVGVRVESLSYGRAEADLVAGLATYVGQKSGLIATTKEPDLRSWFGYSLQGEYLGAAHVIELRAVAAALGEDVPERPLRTFCERTGARYCYDVDWVHTVARIDGEPVLFLSRPAPVFVRAAGPESGLPAFLEAFGRAPDPEATWRAYPLSASGMLLVEAKRQSVELRWRLRSSGPWQLQSYGEGEGGAVSPSARLLAVLDLQRDGLPELVIQRITREPVPGGVRDANDEIQLVHLATPTSRFTVLNRLTVHEY